MERRVRKRRSRAEGAAVDTESSGQRRRRQVWGISRDMLEGILEIAREKYPNEFVALLIHRGGIIREIEMLPGTVEGSRHAIIMTHMAPPDLSFSKVGSVHSHPSPNFWPSDADRAMFAKQGHTHIIVAYPFTARTWQAYDRRGEVVRLEVVG